MRLYGFNGSFFSLYSEHEAPKTQVVPADFMAALRTVRLSFPRFNRKARS